MNIECQEPPNREATTAIMKALYGLTSNCKISTLSYCLSKALEAHEREHAYEILQQTRKELEDEKKSSRLFAYVVLVLNGITLLLKVTEKFID